MNVAELPEDLRFTPPFPKAKHHAIAKMVFFGGGWLVVSAVLRLMLTGVSVVADAGPGTFFLISAVVSGGSGLICLQRGGLLMRDRGWLEAPPFLPAAVLMLNLFCGDLISFCLGACVTVWLFEPEIRRYYQG